MKPYVMTEHAVHILPYRDLGSGITRALHDWPDIELVDDVGANQFRVVIPRPHPHPHSSVFQGTSTADTTTEQHPPTGEVERLLEALKGEMKRTDLQAALGLKHEDHFRSVPAPSAGR